jgi:2,5-diamino-6-(ribosylamino)-4(3H)-pyrimidinone 5'-phosphate reductase
MHVLANVAASADGKLSTRAREQVPISGPADFDRVDRLRADSDAVMVGVGTVLADDPSLTVDDDERLTDREERGAPRQPTRVVADSRARTPVDARVLDDAAPTIVLVSEAADAERIEGLRAAGATVIATAPTDEERVDLPAAFEHLEDGGIDRLLVEGGGELLFSLFAAGLIDRLSVYVGTCVIGGRDAPTLADGAGFRDDFVDLSLASVERIDDGVLLEWDVDGRGA